MKIKFGDLSTALKIAVVGGWLGGISFAIGFIVGFFGAL